MQSKPIKVWTVEWLDDSGERTDCWMPDLDCVADTPRVAQKLRADEISKCAIAGLVTPTYMRRHSRVRPYTLTPINKPKGRKHAKRSEVRP